SSDLGGVVVRAGPLHALGIPANLAGAFDRAGSADASGKNVTARANGRRCIVRRHSLAGPLILIVIGVAFLARNVWQEVPLFELVSRYWPFILIAWGVMRLLEVFVEAARSKPLPSGRLSGSEVAGARSEEHTSELQSRFDLVCRLLLEKKKRISTHLRRRS